METKLSRGTIEDVRWLEGGGDCLKQAVTFRLSKAGADLIRSNAAQAASSSSSSASGSSAAKPPALPRVGEPVRFVRCFWRAGGRSPSALARIAAARGPVGTASGLAAQQQVLQAVTAILQRPVMAALR